MLMKYDRSEFVIETRQLRGGFKYVLREKLYSNLSAPYSIIEISVHSSMQEARYALQESKFC